ncbi:MAG: methylenetetrahydrofolate--tRNA-(uracil(54)-C(5))-methyltransferase (FADH(2)-oxidizing) TrmFO [Bacilli bacterium]|jgi:methylenetetrahydrofolate--tRNA-(uracil-5-)-methyltransferase|nr:methylenetetrahydrofolate--tRNA-(uracil(54)-C(5))-methyltransferase (FADH(2)-oxidizing) TrmFO [Bacilli bacterium]NLN80319.1 methylenetetrahydrofolate--tRNA-(uracil(54)-C(5))-methyltransferase (FADH(2)-oxidizing) TrmFO [Erysipelotrichia bacterium]
MKKIVKIIGGGLAGVEAAHFLANKGIEVHLYEMRPKKNTPAHHTSFLSELVCSNSLKSTSLNHASGLLKKEMEILNSLVLEAAFKNSVPSGQALSVDRHLFSEYITRKIVNHPKIVFHNEEVKSLDDEVTIIATGPLTSLDLVNELQKIILSKSLFFYDASAPIITKESIDLDIAYYKSRYDQDDDSYLNCPMTKDEYVNFYEQLIKAETVKLKAFEENYFEACTPIEVLAKRGIKTLLYGPLRPKGLALDKNNPPYAVVQLRQDNVHASLYNLVGFQTNLKYREQQRVFSLIPGLQNAEFIRYGLMHRNTYLNAPEILDKNLFLKAKPNVLIAGQLIGVEGYLESAVSGLISGIVAYLFLTKKEIILPPLETMTGSLINYIISAHPKHFTPMNANFGILINTSKKTRHKDVELAIKEMEKYWQKINE